MSYDPGFHSWIKLSAYAHQKAYMRMFIADIISQTWKESKCLRRVEGVSSGISMQWSITQQYKRNDLIHRTWINLTDTALNNRRQIQKKTYCISLHMPIHET